MVNKIPGSKKGIFFDIASEVEKEDLKRVAGKGKSGKYTITNNQLYAPILGKKTRVNYMDLMGVTAISTPEAEIISGAGGLWVKILCCQDII